MARAIENSRLYRERDYVARTLQRSLLPPVLPEVPGVEVETLFLPAFRGYEVGGDFYDVFEKPKGRWAAVIGDVCGKGVEAAALTGLARHTLRALFEIDRPRATRSASSTVHCCASNSTAASARSRTSTSNPTLRRRPADHRLWRSPVAASDRRRRVDLARRTLRDADRRHRGSSHRRRRRSACSPGEAIVLFTDGILRKDEAFGDEPNGLTTALRSTRFDSAAEIRERIEVYVRDLIAEEQNDDIAVLVIRAR